jgi:hypothetical protein
MEDIRVNFGLKIIEKNSFEKCIRTYVTNQYIKVLFDKLPSIIQQITFNADRCSKIKKLQ